MALELTVNEWVKDDGKGGGMPQTEGEGSQKQRCEETKMQRSSASTP